MIEEIVREVLSRLGPEQAGVFRREELSGGPELAEENLTDITDPLSKQEVLLPSSLDPEALAKMKTKTSARIGIGRSGPRLNTRTMLTLRADHATARDAVFMDVDQSLLDRMGLFSVQTKCTDKNVHLTRPDLGRQLDKMALDTIQAQCRKNPDVQIMVADGLSSKAVEANLENILPAITEGLGQYHLSLGTPFFVKYGRVPVMEVISETLGSEVICILIGERPGLATAGSMSAYIAYRATVGMPEARRTVVSNIHENGISAVEAGAYIAEIIKKMHDLKMSGVDLRL